MKEWHGEDGGVDQRGLYFVSARNPHGKWDWFEIGGRWADCDPNRDLPHAFVTPGGVWKARRWWNWNEANSSGDFENVDDLTWEKEWKTAKKEFSAFVLVVVDCHH